MTHTDTALLFTESLNVINTALFENRDRMPYKPLLSASEKVLQDRQLGVAIYDEDASAPFDYFTIRYHDGTFEVLSHGKQQPEIAWRVSRDYLEKVAANPREYVEHPARLDWDWLKSRVGLEG